MTARVITNGPGGTPIPGGMVTVIPAWLWDSKRFSPVTFFTSAFGYYSLFLTGPQTLSVQGVTNATAITAGRNTIDIMVDGAYSTSLTFTDPSLPQTQTFAVPSGDHRIDILNGMGFECACNAFQAVGFIRIPSKPSKRIVLCGASGTYGYNPLSMDASFSWYGRFRRIGRFDGGYNRSTSGASLQTYIQFGIPFFISDLAQYLDGSVENELWFETDAGQYLANLAAAQYQTDKAATYVALHAAYPNLVITDQQAIIIVSPTEATANGGGNVMQDYRNATAAAAAGKTYVTVLDGKLMGQAPDISFDGKHEIQGVLTPSPGTGYGKAFNVVRQAIGNQSQLPSFVSAAAIIKPTNSQNNPPDILGQANTLAWWTQGGGITIHGTPFQTGVGGALTITGQLLRQDCLLWKITTAGTGNAAKFDLSLDSGNSFILTNQPCNASVSLFGGTLTCTWPNVAYSLNTTYQASVATWLDSTGQQTMVAADNTVLLNYEVSTGQRFVSGNGTTGELNSGLALPANNVTATFVSGIWRIDQWVNGHRLFGCKTGNDFVGFMNSATPNVSASGNGSTVIPAGGLSGMSTSAFKRLDMNFSGSTNDYIHAGAQSQTGVSFGVGSGSVFSFFKTINSFVGKVSLKDFAMRKLDPGSTLRGNLDTFWASQYGAGVLT